jgi:hypothetical protein
MDAPAQNQKKYVFWAGTQPYLGQKISQRNAKSYNVAIDEKDVVHPPGVEPIDVVRTCCLR